ncbi:hypothetical protein NQ318_012917 [Aromia moschata]|uniref:Uncharacterized protein n=1 Tax=Aromia moschata TaxID=1265417 RepID=A0AAV8X7V9_9CUCU|nr:hypothetical protein NQ318_012917 [Aromia moschata]
MIWNTTISSAIHAGNSQSGRTSKATRPSRGNSSVCKAPGEKMAITPRAIIRAGSNPACGNWHLSQGLVAWFHLSGYVNSQNMRVWSSYNPHFYIETLLHSQKLECGPL